MPAVAVIGGIATAAGRHLARQRSLAGGDFGNVAAGLAFVGGVTSAPVALPATRS